MAEPFLAEVRMFSFGFAPKGWALCNGQLLPINQNQALFSLVGTIFGGDGRVNFALPDLRARTPFHVGTGYAWGQQGGASSHTLTIQEMPSHGHQTVGSTQPPNSGTPGGNTWATAAANAYGTAPDGVMNPASVDLMGGGLPHENRPPYLTLSFGIALQGIFPSRS